MTSVSPRIECEVCHVRRRVESSHRLCDHCARDARAVQRIVELILKKFPKMSVYTTPELLVRLWMTFEPVRRDPQALHEAEELQRAFSAALISEPPKPENPDAHRALKKARQKRGSGGSSAPP